MGRIVIETDPDTGLDDVELTLDTGQVIKFCGRGDSELKLIRGGYDLVDVSTAGQGAGTHFTPGMRMGDHWEFTLKIEDITATRTEYHPKG